MTDALLAQSESTLLHVTQFRSSLRPLCSGASGCFSRELVFGLYSLFHIWQSVHAGGRMRQGLEELRVVFTDSAVRPETEIEKEEEEVFTEG